jgi:hypothetical protein
MAMPEIKAINPVTKQDYKEQVVTADLESLILPEGHNYVYMAAWYNGTRKVTYDLTQFNFNRENMLIAFWNDLIKHNNQAYFHNFGGYDAILSIQSLLNTSFNYTFKPIMKDGEFISIQVLQNKKVVLTIMDSIKILPCQGVPMPPARLPSSLSKLAKDWKVETMKSHFPHYFWVGNILTTLNYKGVIPPYTCFEPKRTSLTEYNEMKELFSTKSWSFLDLAKAYILDDCKALYEVLIKFFSTLESKFPIDVLRILSAPSAAFRIWRTTQLPLLIRNGLQVPDLSISLDPKIRPGYCGGIVDVYRPHLKGQGFYYDVNSLYPTAMCKPMPVGKPLLVQLTVEAFLETDFFGFLEATVRAPDNEYIGLLPIKIKGRLICPGGVFS